LVNGPHLQIINVAAVVDANRKMNICFSAFHRLQSQYRLIFILFFPMPCASYQCS
jgi:hypothetical protein